MIRRSTILICAIAVTATAGCGGSRRDRSGDFNGLRQGGQMLQSRSNMNLLRKAVVEHHQETGRWPNSLLEVRGRVLAFDVTMRNPVTGADPGYLYQKPPDGASDSTVILFQIRDGQIDQALETMTLGG